MKKYGLIGYPLSHSFSKSYFAEKFAKEHISDCVYENYPLENIEQFKDLLPANPDLRGLNVTIPYKEKVFPYLDAIDTEAAEIGAVNTIKITRDGVHFATKGFNTDAYGFQASLAPMLKSNHQKALILGTGGAAKAVEYVLEKMGMTVQYVSRQARMGILSYQQLDEEAMTTHTVIVNTSPLGMYPKTEACPDLPYQFVNEQHVLYDLIYNPETTLFMQKGLDAGASVKNGLEMLHLQAEKAWEIWNQ